MCGIFGIIAEKVKIEREHICSRALSKMSARGPDGEGLFSSGNCTLAHNRLAIIDSAGGKQPMITGDKRYVIVFNGEIVNFKELIPELKRRGFYQATMSDTEVLLQCFQAYGSDVVHKIKGMFAFAIFDTHTQELFLARDPLGICPLFYYIESDTLLFGSDSKSFYDKAIINFEPNVQRFNEFLVFGQIYGKSTLHNNVYEFPAGSFGTYSIQGGLKTNNYLKLNNSEENLSINEIEDLLEKQLLDIAKDWSQSDAGLSSFLSGGLDSTTLSTMISNHGRKIDLYTFYAKDDPHSEEISLATMIANTLPQKFNKIELKNENIISDMLLLQSKYADPLHDSNSLTAFNLCNAIKNQSDNKVVITGEGADELFGGYDRHHTIAKIHNVSHDHSDIAWGLNRVAIKRLNYFTKPTDFTDTERFKFSASLTANDSLGKVLEFDQSAFMPAYLQRQNQIGLLFSLELRPPFLDDRLVNLANRIPSNLKNASCGQDAFMYKKYILRKVAQKFIPRNICWNKQKYQFSYPAGHHFDSGNAFHKLFTELLHSNSNLSNYYDVVGIKDLLDDHNSREPNQDHSNTLFRLMSLELWLTAMKNDSL